MNQKNQSWHRRRNRLHRRRTAPACSASHPNVEVTAITSRAKRALPLPITFPVCAAFADLTFQTPDQARLDQCDVVFFATPNGVAMKEAPALLNQNVRIVDLSADFRIQDIPTWEQWYGMRHASPDIIPQAVYGLSEMNRDAIANTHRRQPRLLSHLRFTALIAFVATRSSESTHAIDCRLQIRRLRRRAQGQHRFTPLRSGRQFQSIRYRRTPPPSRNQTNHPNIAGRHCRWFCLHPHLTPMIRGMHATLTCILRTVAIRRDTSRILSG